MSTRAPRSTGSRVAEMQLLEIARLLVRDARILIFDEPTAALADREIERVLAVIKRLAAEGRSIIYVTHRLPEVFRIADRVTVFRNGRSLPAKPTSDLDVDAVITMMLGRDLETMFPAARHDRRRRAAARGRRAARRRAVRSRSASPSARARSSASPASSAAAPPTSSRRSPACVRRRPAASSSAARRYRSGAAPRRSSAASPTARPTASATASSPSGPIRENLSSPWIRSVAPGGFISARRERDKAGEIAARFAIDVKRMGSPVGTLSGGNQQKVAVGKWLGTEPRVMLLEEPTRGVDIGARAEIYQRLRDLCAAGLGIVVSSSDTAEVLGLSDTIATFYRGRLTAMRPQAEWTEDALVREVMHQEAAA